VTDPLRVAWVAARGQLVSFVRSPVTALLALALPLNLLLLLSLFALTGYHAPTGLVLGEDTSASRSFVQALRDAHNSFELRPMTRADALDQLRHGRLVAMIEVPTGFAADVAAGRPARVPLTIDNVNLDLTEDVRRAVPAAAAIFADRQARPGIRVTADLRNTLPHDTGYVDYLGVSAVALAAVIAGGVLGGTVTAREWETGGMRLLRVAPGGAGPVLAGRLAAAALVGLLATAIAVAVVVAGYGAPLKHPVEAAVVVVATVACATALGGVAGRWLRRTLVIAPLVVGLTLPFYLDSGALEPQRFDGERLFWIAHLSPTYFGVGALEHAFHGLDVTPEPVWALVAVLFGVAAAAVALLLGTGRR